MFSDGASSIPPQGPDDPNKPQPLQPSQKNKEQPLTPSDDGSKMVLGMSFTNEQYAKFLSQMINGMMDQMKTESANMVKALKKLNPDDQDS